MLRILALVSVIAAFTNATNNVGCPSTAGGCSCSCSSTPLTQFSSHSSIKQCAFNNINDPRDAGQIATCSFRKSSSDTALRATWQGDIRMVGCADKKCCRRWYLTFNGKECSSPQPIDAVVYAAPNMNIHRPGTLDGFCENISKGSVVVGISVGDCPSVLGMPRGNARTGWHSVARLIIEEVPPLQ